MGFGSLDTARGTLLLALGTKIPTLVTLILRLGTILSAVEPLSWPLERNWFGVLDSSTTILYIGTGYHDIGTGNVHFYAENLITGKIIGTLILDGISNLIKALIGTVQRLLR
jgi:hypothetical protein